MENKIMMPASYNVLSCEEMTYTEGGATVGQAVAAWLWPGYATVIGINTCREARKKDHDNWASNVWSDIKADCKGNVLAHLTALRALRPRGDAGQGGISQTGEKEPRQGGQRLRGNGRRLKA